MREYELQTRVKAVDGQTVMRDEENFYKQSRVFVKDGQEAQIAWVDDHQCCMWLSDWGVSQTVDELVKRLGIFLVGFLCGALL